MDPSGLVRASMGDSTYFANRAIEECLTGTNEHITTSYVEERAKIWNVATFFQQTLRIAEQTFIKKDGREDDSLITAECAEEPFKVDPDNFTTGEMLPMREIESQEDTSHQTLKRSSTSYDSPAFTGFKAPLS